MAHSKPTRFHWLVLTDADAEGIEPLSPRQAFMELVRHSYLLSILKATNSAATHFRQATAVASQVPVARLLRRRSLGALPKVAAVAEEHCVSVPSIGDR
jgi:hypothetical protein